MRTRKKLIAPVVVSPAFLTKEECEQIIAIFKSDESALPDNMEGKEGKRLEFIELYRTSCVDWLYKKIFQALRVVNRTNFKFEISLSASTENIYVNCYRGGADSFRGWHVDGFTADNPDYNTRKLSVVIQLTDPQEYIGGDLKFMEYHHPTVDIRQQGTMLMFPSFEWHKVEKITAGTRYSLVLFIHGNEPFK